MDKTIPLKETEARELQLIWATREILSEPSARLAKRLRACRRWRQYRAASVWIDHITNDLMDSVEADKRRKFLMNLRNQEIRIVNKHAADASPDFTLVESDDLRFYIKEALCSRCLICSGLKSDMAKCELRKALKRTTLIDVDESDGECMGTRLLVHMEGCN